MTDPYGEIDISRESHFKIRARRSSDLRGKEGNMSGAEPKGEEIQTTIQQIRVLIAKLQSQTEDVVGDMCDNYCRHPREIKDEDLLNDICEQCPLNKLM